MELLKNLEGLSADEQMTAVVELQKAAMKHLEEQKQASIGKSAELVIQGLKKIKSDFEAKFDSLNYDIQTKVASLKDGEQGLQGPKGDQGERGLDGSNGRDGRDGIDGKDGVDGVDGVGVRDAKIDFDGSLVISLTDGREINCGEVVSVDVAKQIQKVTHNIQTGAGGDSQTVLDAIAAIQATIATYGTMATQNANNVAITGGAINNTTIGATTPSTGVFTTLTATGQTSLGGVADAEALRAVTTASAINWVQVSGATNGNAPSVLATGANTSVFLDLASKGTAGGVRFKTAVSTEQMRVSHTASAVNYVQVTGGASGSQPKIQSAGNSIALALSGNGANGISFWSNSFATQQFAVAHTATSVNYLQAQGSATGNGLQFSAQGTDTNISQVFQPKGTGAIDLAAGSSGVNISNGGTVTAITRTANGSYTSMPTAVISAPTTAGGTQATLSPLMAGSTATVVAGGTGYTVGDTLTIVGATGTASQFTVATLSGSAVATVTFTTSGSMSALPTNPVSVTGGTGTGATFNMTYSLAATQSSFTAGSGYVEQPTVTFSGGGGSGASAYATVGSTQIVRGLNDISFYSPGGEALRILDRGIGSLVNYAQVSGATTTNAVRFSGQGSDTNVPVFIGSKGTSQVSTYTNNFGQEQFRVSHTASAVNYVQVTGAATGGRVTISAQGSDANVPLVIGTKGSGSLNVRTNDSVTTQFAVTSTASAVNYINITGGVASSAPTISALGTDTNIDLALTPKGTGRVKFGTYTANMALTVQGYIEIVDSGGTIRKLAVIA